MFLFEAYGDEPEFRQLLGMTEREDVEPMQPLFRQHVESMAVFERATLALFHGKHVASAVCCWPSFAMPRRCRRALAHRRQPQPQ